MKLPKELTTVTPLSKRLAGILFILLPFVGFFLGMEYQKRVRIYDQNLVIQPASTTPKPIELVGNYTDSETILKTLILL